MFNRTQGSIREPIVTRIVTTAVEIRYVRSDVSTTRGNAFPRVAEKKRKNQRSN